MQKCPKVRAKMDAIPVFDKLSLELYPNPANNTLKLDFNEQSLSEEVEVVTVKDMLGRFQESLKWDKAGIVLDTSLYPEGIYFISLKLKGHATFVTKRFLIKH
jgi:Secretion system C-terminal sorting domain